MSKATAKGGRVRPCNLSAGGRSFLSILLLPALVSGCAVRSTPEIKTSDGAKLILGSIHLLLPEAEQSQRLAMHAALTDALSGRGIAVSKDAETVGEFSVSSGDAQVGVYVSEAGKSDREPRPVSEPRKSRWLDLCTPVRVQAGLAVFDRSSGKLAKRSSAQATVCEGDELPFTELAAILTDNILTD